jgi:hypothetical protein
LVTGCVVVHDHSQQPPPPPPFHPPPPTISVDTYRIAPGAVTVVDTSRPGYGITANIGNSYRAVWTGNTSLGYNEFRGYIYTPGTFTSVTPGCSDGSCALSTGDTISSVSAVAGGGQQIDFDTIASDGNLDGLDFTVDIEPVEFYMEVQGVADPTLVFFTSTDTGVVSNPAHLPFALTTQ